MKPTIRTLSLQELAVLVDWAAAEGWNPGLEDAAMFQAADPEGFIGAFVGNEMVAAVSAVAYGSEFGFIGLYICRPDMRGKGYGKAVWNAGMTRLAGRTIGLDGVAEQQANYRSKGFRPAYETIRYSGRTAGPAVNADGLRTVTTELVPDIIAYDTHCFPGPRRAFLHRWLQAPHHGLAAISSRGTTGYAVARPCRSGFKIGPLFADDLEIALQLLDGLAGTCGSGDLHIDVPADNIGFIAALESGGFAPTFTTTRMYKGPAPKFGLQRLFGVTTLELG